jgi:uncharacterized protein (TIGR02145 family)
MHQNNMNRVKMLVVGLITALQPLFMYGQVVIGHAPPDGSAALDIQATNLGVLLPRLTTAERNAIQAPATGLLIFNITTLCLEVNNGTGSSPEWSAFKCRTGVVTGLDCAGVTVTGTLNAGQAASGVSASVPYTGGNSGVYAGQTVTSTGVAGLTATLSAGNFADGPGSVSYDITGTPSGAGTASFALNIGGQNCTLNVTVSYFCKAKTDATTFSKFLCYNLGAANTSADPFTPSWEINGGYWQWGSKTEAAAGPVGPNAGDANDGAVSGWNTTVAPDGAWSDASKTSSDPCPAGYRVPTKAQWDGLIANNTMTAVGSSWTDDPTNYSSGMKFGNDLLLPTAGVRFFNNGALFFRGTTGYYWSSTEDVNNLAWAVGFDNMNNNTVNESRLFGTTIRCIEYASAIGSLDCGGSTMTGTLAESLEASGVSVSVPYTGGNGSAHSGQTVTSTGVTGLTATLSAGNFAMGSGALSYVITGTPSAAGTANFELNIGGHSCTLEVNVSYYCRAKTDATTFSRFLCYNLGAANTNADPFTPSWEINGGYWQWGRKAEAAPGPTGPNAGDANAGTISGWNTAFAPVGSWIDGAKTENDPCPAGYRVPTRAQWDGVTGNNTNTYVGTWSNNSTNYSSGLRLGNDLFLPRAGTRNPNNGALNSRGYIGEYCSSTEANSNNWSWGLIFTNSGNAWTTDYFRTFGRSVRCIEYQSAIGSLDCGGSSTTGALIPGQAASGVSVSVPYTGGNGSAHSGQTVTSTGVTGLTATLSAGNFATGSGALSYVITGTPSAVGTASFELNIGGHSCTITVAVSNCYAKTDATAFKSFMCHNLGAANTSADPFTPGWEINGGYWQWGRVAEAAPGPAGPGAGDANDGAISGWNTTGAPNASWSDATKTSNDPCPSGFRVPTKAQWDGLVDNNTGASVGTWTNNPTNYTSGRMFGSGLFIPANGQRFLDVGDLKGRGSYGNYWSSTENGTVNAEYFSIGNGSAGTDYDVRTFGFSVRCIAQ